MKKIGFYEQSDYGLICFWFACHFLLYLVTHGVLYVKDELYDQRKTVAKITGDTMCSLCHKKIGTSVFAVYPNGKNIVHFVCFKDSQNMDAVSKGSIMRKKWSSEWGFHWTVHVNPPTLHSKKILNCMFCQCLSAWRFPEVIYLADNYKWRQDEGKMKAYRWLSSYIYLLYICNEFEICVLADIWGACIDAQEWVWCL